MTLALPKKLLVMIPVLLYSTRATALRTDVCVSGDRGDSASLAEYLERYSLINKSQNQESFSLGDSGGPYEIGLFSFFDFLDLFTYLITPSW
jgi:hypothetical protein